MAEWPRCLGSRELFVQRGGLIVRRWNSTERMDVSMRWQKEKKRQEEKQKSRPNGWPEIWGIGDIEI